MFEVISRMFFLWLSVSGEEALLVACHSPVLLLRLEVLKGQYSVYYTYTRLYCLYKMPYWLKNVPFFFFWQLVGTFIKKKIVFLKRSYSYYKRYADTSILQFFSMFCNLLSFSLEKSSFLSKRNVCLLTTPIPSPPSSGPFFCGFPYFCYLRNSRSFLRWTTLQPSQHQMPKQGLIIL